MSSFGGISFTGLASGLDTRAIIGALMEAESQPLRRLQARQEMFQGRRDAWNGLDATLRTLHGALQPLADGSSFHALQLEQSSEDQLRARLGADAEAGSWSVVVDQLAAAQSNVSTGQADADATVYEGGLVDISSADGSTIEFDFGGMTLNEIAATINAKTALGIRADVVDDGDPNAPYRLVLTAAETGSQNAFSIETAGDGSSVTQLFDSVVSGLTTAAADAKVYLNGVLTTRSSNTIDDLIDGVTLDLLDTSATATRIDVRSDSEAAADGVQEFVDAYNALLDATDKQTAYDPESGDSSALFGDPTLRGILGDLRLAFSQSVSTSSGGNNYTLPALVGLDTDRDGRLSFDREEFDAALADDPDAVAELFNSSDGLATSLDAILDRHLETGTGTVALRLDGIDDRIGDLGDSVQRAERRLAALQTSMESRFAALETLLARIQQQGRALGAFPQ